MIGQLKLEIKEIMTFCAVDDLCSSTSYHIFLFPSTLSNYLVLTLLSTWNGQLKNLVTSQRHYIDHRWAIRKFKLCSTFGISLVSSSLCLKSAQQLFSTVLLRSEEV